MTPKANLMAHEPYMTFDEPTWLSRAELREHLAGLEKHLDWMAEYFASHSLVSKSEYLARVSAGDWNIGSEEALKLGLISAIVPSVSAAEALAHDTVAGLRGVRTVAAGHR
jgi:ATP-dependent protease ClpP protease subunit